MEFTTTFWNDFSIADRFGIEAIEDTYNRSFRDFKNDIRYMTDLSLVLNHKLRDWYPKDKEVAKVYDRLWKEVDEYVYDHFEGDDIVYYYEHTD